MAGHDVLFDTDGSSRIGFAVSTCEYTKLVESISTSTSSQQDSTASPNHGSVSKAPTRKPTPKPTSGVKSPNNSSSSNTNRSQVGIGIGLALLITAVIIFIVIIRRRRKRIQRGKYRQTIGLDELELDDDEDLEIPPVI
jgi:hypothetical protein